LVGTPHAAEVRSDPLYQTARHGAAGSRLRLAPAEGDAEGGAAGAAVKAGGYIAHRMAFLDSLRWSESLRRTGGVPQGGDANCSCEAHPQPAAGDFAPTIGSRSVAVRELLKSDVVAGLDPSRLNRIAGHMEDKYLATGKLPCAVPLVGREGRI